METRYFFTLPESVSNTATKLAKEYSAKLSSYYCVDGSTFLPHITLFSSTHDISQVRDMQTDIQSMISEFYAIPLEITKAAVSKDGTLWLEIRYSDDLKNFRDKLLTLVESKLGATLRKDKEYKPHITLTRYSDLDAAMKLLEDFPSVAQSFKATGVGVGHCDDPGTIYDGQIRSVEVKVLF